MYLEPINGATVDKRRELSETIAEGVTDRGECDDDVKILPATVDEESKESQWTKVCVLISSLGYRTNSLKKKQVQLVLCPNNVFQPVTFSLKM